MGEPICQSGKAHLHALCARACEYDTGKPHLGGIERGTYMPNMSCFSYFPLDFLEGYKMQDEYDDD